jgi:hypothetical protein
MSPLNAVICTTISYTLWVEWYYSTSCLPTYCFSLICFLPLLLSEAYPNHNFFVFRDRSMIFGMWVHDRVPHRFHEGHYGTQHTALWSCTHIPNIIDLSRKSNMLWPGEENIIYKKQLFDLEVKGLTKVKLLYRCNFWLYILIHVL